MNLFYTVFNYCIYSKKNILRYRNNGEQWYKIPNHINHFILHASDAVPVEQSFKTYSSHGVDDAGTIVPIGCRDWGIDCEKRNTRPWERMRTVSIRSILQGT